ncbi:hypothetical protein [Dyella psychrodurans]|uniref:Replication protein n=1 Tax=Dyella psychrodurans TaxID=1927960 RepID=A0A370WXU5_9GAMM|nr:hypothetical protein [Dyella psychrodurans]RDS80973.1 hypothetical protein DWU99_18140 [Dyella psychrodurans]
MRSFNTYPLYKETKTNNGKDRSDVKLYNLRKRYHTKALIEQFGPYRFFITLSFNLELSRRKAHEYGEKFARRLIKKIVHKRWQSKGLLPLTGIVIFETADVIRNSTRKNGGWHLHFLVHDYPSLPKDDKQALKVMTDAYWTSAERLWLRGVKRKKRKPMDMQLVTKTRVRLENGDGDIKKAKQKAKEEDRKKVQLVTDLKGLCEYLSKEAWKPEWDWVDRFLYLGSQGIQSEPDQNPAQKLVSLPRVKPLELFPVPPSG